MTDSVAAAKLAVYIVLAQPALYCLFKHGKTGFLGWFYVQLFCVLRIVTGGIGLHNSSISTGSIILNSIGLSPLLLAASGILHEARRATNPRLNRKLDLFLEIQYHGLMGVAMTLIIVAVINLPKGNSVETMKTLLKVASALVALSWVLLIIWALWSLAKSRASSTTGHVPAMSGGKLLLNGVFVSIPFSGLRLAYAIAFLQLRISDPESGFLTSKAVDVCLNVVPEMLATVILLYVGLKTRSLKHEIKKMDDSLPIDQGYEMPTHDKQQERR
ncbi:hypothetical protein FALBO_12917 [Fusarium albosuccineum]|uniref:DUF7702 domain-containing protein n=1 Tax=Fusarium albosuccineum TaxID=1237068 RepID=A0A8H4PGS6_9HYPO|nr:hypothetical protein FALBO_12917 [Fusarium albosuccineum]